MSDTTPMIAWLEEDQPAPSVIPADPVQRYLSLLVEDYADEWLWRPAMYYRWSYAPDRYLASTRLAEEIIRIPGVPLAARRRWVAKRTRGCARTPGGPRTAGAESRSPACSCRWPGGRAARPRPPKYLPSIERISNEIKYLWPYTSY